MASIRYLIVGGGLAADSACKGIRERDPEGRQLDAAREPIQHGEPVARGVQAG
ncbi:MAG TPA: hypothetical protein VFW80_04080 [Gaiellaceae bacterium]|nr:hypothetical protein [Gaiellaceae bacterium]